MKFNPDDYEVKQVFYRSKDGTRVPMFIAHKKGIKLDGSNPTLLYGYGGFNISAAAHVLRSAAWRGWRWAASTPSRTSAAAANTARRGTRRARSSRSRTSSTTSSPPPSGSSRNKYTRPDKLAIQGGSNGGLLVGAVMTQRPDLFGACLPAVGVMDMLRFHKFTEGRLWVDDYGSSDNPEEFKALLAYSPYHNIKPGTCYPATLVTTADTDDRVVPGHSFKFAAALQRAQAVRQARC